MHPLFLWRFVLRSASQYSYARMAQRCEVRNQNAWLVYDTDPSDYSDRSYIEPVQIGATMRGLGLGTVVARGSEAKYQIGDVLEGTTGTATAWLGSGS